LKRISSVSGPGLAESKERAQPKRKREESEDPSQSTLSLQGIQEVETSPALLTVGDLLTVQPVESAERTRHQEADDEPIHEIPPEMVEDGSEQLGLGGCLDRLPDVHRVDGNLAVLASQGKDLIQSLLLDGIGRHLPQPTQFAHLFAHRSWERDAFAVVLVRFLAHSKGGGELPMGKLNSRLTKEKKKKVSSMGEKKQGKNFT
jgi:hypothetical protein